MYQLHLSFLGSFTVLLNRKTVTDFESNKVRALLIYLAVERRSHGRGALAALLWPDYGETNARTNLRQVLYQLRRTLGDDEAKPPFLIINRQTIGLNPAANCAVDVTIFRELLAAAASHRHAQLATCERCLERLRQAVALYDGDFLSGFGLDDSDAFEEWRRVIQEQMHLQMLDALHQLTQVAIGQGDDASALRYAQKQLVLEPWREEAHRQLMHTLAQSGQRAAALAQYHSCRQMLRKELGVEPDPTTTTLYAQIEAGELNKLSPTLNHNRTLTFAYSDPPPFLDWAEMPTVDHFHGRNAELAELESWLLHERCRLVSVLGIGGSGKTALAAKLAQQIAGEFEVVIWRSLLSAPPLDEILRSWLQILARQSALQLPASFDEQMHLLLSYLRQQRCLLVLDNIETILQTGDQGSEVYPGYEDFERLLQRLGSSAHRSSLLLTSREQPQILMQRARHMAAMRTLQLSGLDAAAGQAILHMHGLKTSPAEAASLVEQYSGNPLALQMVATTIIDFFGSDIALFQHTEVPAFDGIRSVLDEQFSRLSEQEREIALWLAIEREPITVPALRANLVQPPPMHELLKALRSLQRRSLLEMAGDGFTLQNVVIEYMLGYLIDQVCREIEAEQLTEGETSAEVASANRMARPASPHPLTLSMLNRHALLKAQAKEYVRQSQARLIVQPIVQRLQAKLGKERLVIQLQRILNVLRTQRDQPGYAGGNILNILLQLRVDLSGYDLSHLCIWQVDLRQLTFTALNFTETNLARSTFPFTFNTNAVHFSPAGELMITGVAKGDLCLWYSGEGFSDGQLVDGFRNPCGDGFPVIFSPDGQLIIVAGFDHAIRIWSTATGACLHTLYGHSSKIYSLAVSADGSLLASGTGERLVYLWDLRSGHLRQTLDGHENGVGALAFSHNGRTLASGGSDHAIRLWDTQASVANSQPMSVLVGHQREIGALAFAPDDALLASGSHDGVIRLWDLKKLGECLNTLHGHASIVRTLLFHPEGNRLASGSADQTIRLWALPGQLMHTLLGHTDEVESLAFSPDGDKIVGSGADQRVSWWDVHTGNALNALQGYRNGIAAVRFSPDGRMTASGGSDHLIRLRNVQTGQVRHILRGHTQQIRAVAFSPLLNHPVRLLASGSDDRSVRLWEVATGQELHTLWGHGGVVKCVTFSSDGNFVASGGMDQSIRLWPVVENLQRKSNLHRTLSGHQAEITAIAFCRDDKTLISSSLDHTARLWAVESGELLHILEGHTAALSCAAVSADGCTVATISFDRMVRLWDTATAECLAVRADEQIGNRVVAFSADGEFLAYDGIDFAIYVRRWRTWELVAVLSGHTNAVLSLDFSATAPLLASSGWDGSLRLWDVESGNCVQTWRDPGPYAGMNITGVTGISDAQKAALIALGAVEE